MQALRSLWPRLKALAKRRELERDLDDELSLHLALREQHYAADGLDASQARYAARRRFGNALALKQECRELWTFTRAETLLQDARYALRVMARTPWFTATAVLSLALGIGANTAIFSFVNALLLRPLPYPAAERLVRLTGFYPKGALAAMQELSQAMDVAGFSTGNELNLTGQGEAVRLSGSVVSANLFSVLGRGAALGRAFEPGEDRPGRDGVVVLSHALWATRFGADPAAIGRAISVDGVDRTIVGVMPATFQFPSAAVQLWVPLRLDPSRSEDYWGFGWMPLVARMRPGVTQARAQDELRTLRARVVPMFPWEAASWNPDIAAIPLQDDIVRDVRRKLLVLQGAVGIVLLIACANVANLLLSRAAVRRKELALRSALGASRGRILRQLLTESVALSLLGGALGIGLAHVALSGLRAMLADASSGPALVGIDAGVLVFVTALSLLSGLLFGLAPAATASQADLASSMRDGGRRSSSGGERLRSSFIAAQVALAVVLAVGAGLLIRTLWRLTRVDPGFRPEQTLTLRISPDPSACAERPACVAFYDDLVRRVGALPGVQAAAAANAVPLGGRNPLLPVELEGHPLAEGTAPLVWAGAVTPGYFELMRIPLLRGRAFEPSDGEGTAPVVLVSAATAARYWPGEDPVGKQVRVVWDADWRTVVGVVADVRQYALSGRMPEQITGALYMPYPQSVALDRRIPGTMAILARASGPPAELAERLRSLVAGVRADAAVDEVRGLEAVVASSVDEPRAMTWLFACFAGCALLLAAVGTYGVVSYSTAQRTYEIGVRVAVGATRGDILGMVVGQSLRLVLGGLALGVTAALLLGRGLAGFLYDVAPTDLVTFAAVSAVLLLTALLAGYVPGRRAALTDPVRALRAD
jgi:predicted permease